MSCMPACFYITFCLIGPGGLQRDVAYLGWPIAPWHMNPKFGGREGVVGSQLMSTAVQWSPNNKHWRSNSIFNLCTWPTFLRFCTFCERLLGPWLGICEGWTLMQSFYNGQAYHTWWRLGLFMTHLHWADIQRRVSILTWIIIIINLHWVKKINFAALQ